MDRDQSGCFVICSQRMTDGLQVHRFELPKYVPPSDHRAITDPTEQWLDFLSRRSVGTR
jgi:hypothetical protein